jgi:hypothetical protein
VKLQASNHQAMTFNPLRCLALIALASHSCADTESEAHSDDEGNKSLNNHGFPFILIPA